LTVFKSEIGIKLIFNQTCFRGWKSDVFSVC